MTDGLGAVLAEIAQNGGSRTLGERAYEAIHEAIVTGLLAPSARLPIEEVARGLGMSPMPVREALGRLHEGGLVDLVAHRGATVTALTVDDLREIYVSRLALEPVAVADAARRFSADDAERARDALARHAQAYESGTPLETFSAHTTFHLALYEAAHNPWLTRLIRPLWESSQRYRLSLPPEYRRRLRERLAEHERILEACIAHEPTLAAMELHNHLVHTANRVGARMGQEPLFDNIDEPTAARLPELMPPLPIERLAAI
jgi:DNA-binding GntR family transcriptional regulator